MKNQKWILNAIILGFSFFIAILLVKPIGVSTQFSVLSGIVHSKIDKNVITEDNQRESGYKSTNAYYDKNDGKLAKQIKHPINYDFIFVLRIPLGAFLGYLISSKGKSIKIVKDKNKITIKQYIISFITGFLLLFGARMAGGCTSGHMMSGIMQSSISGFIFAIVVFAFAIPVSILFKNRI